MAHQPANRNQTGTSERIERGAENFKQSTSRTVDRTHDALDSAADSVERGMHRGTDKVAGAAESTVEHTRAAYDQVAAHASDWSDKARDYVREKPTESVLMALAAGWLVGRLMRR